MAGYEARGSADGIPVVSGARVAEFNLGSLPVRIEFPYVVGPLTSLWVLFFAVLNAIALTKKGS